MSNLNNEDNGVNETGTNSEGLSPGRCTMVSSMVPVVTQLLRGGPDENGLTKRIEL